MAQGMQTADKNSREIPTPNNSGSSHKVLLFAGKARKKCYLCGWNHHEKEDAFRDATCHKCGKQGHIVPVCKSCYSGTRQAPPSSSFSGQYHRKKKPTQ